MRKTNNYGLALYDKEDKMSITAEENSLNANMKIIDNALKEKATETYVNNKIAEAQLGGGSSSSGSGLTLQERNTLIEVINAIGVFNVDNGQDLINNFNNAWGETVEEVPATGISLNKSSLEFTTATSQTLVATVTPTDTTDKVTWSSNNNGVATVSNGVVNPISNGSCTITAKAGNYSATCSVTVNVEEEITTYSVTNNLTNVTSDNTNSVVTENNSYTANLSANSGYTLGTVTVTMGGTDITSSAYSNGVVNISNVTGNIVITANAIKESTGGNATNLFSGSYLKATGGGNATVSNNIVKYTPNAQVCTVTFNVENLEADKQYTLFVEPFSDMSTNDKGFQTSVFLTADPAATYTEQLGKLYPAWTAAGVNYCTFTGNGNTLYIWFSETALTEEAYEIPREFSVYIYEGELTERP